jgi:hypothetical protein
MGRHHFFMSNTFFFVNLLRTGKKLTEYKIILIITFYLQKLKGIRQ